MDASRHVPCVAVRPCHHCPSCAFASLPFLRVRLFARLIRWRRRRRCRRLTAPELAPPCLRSEPQPIHTLGRNATMSAPTITLYVSRPGNDALPCSADGPLPTRRLLWCLHRYPLCESPGPFRVNEHCPEQARRERERGEDVSHVSMRSKQLQTADGSDSISPRVAQSCLSGWTCGLFGSPPRAKSLFGACFSSRIHRALARYRDDSRVLILSPSFVAPPFLRRRSQLHFRDQGRTARGASVCVRPRFCGVAVA